MSKARHEILTAVLKHIDPTKKSGTATFETSMRDALVINLTTQIEWQDTLKMSTRIEAAEAAEFLANEINNFTFTELTADNIRNGRYKITYTAKRDTDEIHKMMEQYFACEAVKLAVMLMVKPFFGEPAAPKEKDVTSGKRRPKGMDYKRILSGQFPLSATISDANTQTVRKGELIKVIGDNFLKDKSQYKMESVLLALLMGTSNNDPKSPEYFTGNYTAEPLTVTGVTVGDNPEPVTFDFNRSAMIVKLGDVFRVWSPNEKLGAAGKKSVLKALKNYNTQATINLEITGHDETGKKCRVITNRRRIELAFLVYDNDEVKQMDDLDKWDSEQKILVTFSFAFNLFKREKGDGKRVEAYANTPANIHCLLEKAAGGGKQTETAHYRMYQYLNALKHTGETSLSMAVAIEKAGLQKHLQYRNAHKARAQLTQVLDDISRTGLMTYTTRTGDTGPVFVFKF